VVGIGLVSQQMIVMPGADLFKKARECDNGFPGGEDFATTMSAKAEVVMKLVRPLGRLNGFEVHAGKNIRHSLRAASSNAAFILGLRLTIHRTAAGWYWVEALIIYE